MTNDLTESRHFPNAKHGRITAQIRRQIVQGGYAPGSRLPTRQEFEREFRASRVTVQKALDRLTRDGFIRANGRQGTFVVDRPPHQSRFALLFPQHITAAAYAAPLYRALHAEAATMNQSAPPHPGEERHLVAYYNVQSHQESEDCRRLLRDVRAHRLAGLIFAYNPDPVIDAPLLADASMPAVSMMGGDALPDLPRVIPDFSLWLTRALDYLAKQNRKRVALLTVTGLPIDSDAFIADAGRRGMMVRPWWIQRSHHETPETARNIIRLMFNPNQTERPDALLIFNPSVIETGTVGLADQGLRVPQDLDVVAPCYFPWPLRAAVPVQWLGFNCRALLDEAMRRIEQRRHGETETTITLVPPVFEQEIRQTEFNLPISHLPPAEGERGRNEA